MTFEDAVKAWKDLNYTPYIRSIQNTWFINWETRKSVAFKCVDGKAESEIANFKPDESEIKLIRQTENAIEYADTIHQLGNEGLHVHNHFNK